MARQETTYNLFIGKTIDGTYVFLEDAFKYDDGMKGLTGFELEFHTEDEGKESLDNFFNSDEGYDCYIAYLQRDKPRGVSYDDRCKMVEDERGNDYDDSYCNRECVRNAIDYANNEEGEDYELTNCIGCGRHFNDENTKESYYEYVIPENLAKLQELYKEYEK